MGFVWNLALEWEPCLFYHLSDHWNLLAYQHSFMSASNPWGHDLGTGRRKLLLPTPQMMAEESTPCWKKKRIWRKEGRNEGESDQLIDCPNGRGEDFSGSDQLVTEVWCQIFCQSRATLQIRYLVRHFTSQQFPQEHAERPVRERP